MTVLVSSALESLIIAMADEVCYNPAVSTSFDIVYHYIAVGC